MADEEIQAIEKEIEQEVTKEEVKEVPKEEPKQNFVPHQALHEERLRSKQLQQELSSLREQSTRMETTFQKLLSNLNEKPAPKFEEDPLGHMQSRNETLEKGLKNVSEKLTDMGNQSAQAAFVQQISDKVSSAEAEFRALRPDYDHALKYLKDVTRADLADQGLDHEAIEQTIHAGKIGLAHAASKQGKNPAEIIYERAKRYGYKAPQPQEDKIATLAKGQELSKTVQGGSSSGFGLKDLAQIPEDEIDAICADPKRFQDLIQGKMLR